MSKSVPTLEEVKAKIDASLAEFQGMTYNADLGEGINRKINELFREEGWDMAEFLWHNDDARSYSFDAISTKSNRNEP